MEIKKKILASGFINFQVIFPLCYLFYPVSVLICCLGEGLPSHHLGIFPDLRDDNFNQSNAFGAPYPKCTPLLVLNEYANFVLRGNGTSGLAATTKTTT